MPFLHAQFSNQRLAMAAMDQLMGRGLGRVRVVPVIERPSEPNGRPASPAELGRALLEVELNDGASDREVRALLGSLGATDLTTTEQTETPFPAAAPDASSAARDDVDRAIRASELGATGTDEQTPT
jgi:hypothetical protein